MEDNNSERRIDDRIDTQVPAEYKLFGEEIDILSYEYQKAKTINISKRGVCLAIDSRVKEGDVMRLDVELGDRKKINTFGEVEWCKKESDRYEAGISFISLSNRDTETLNIYLSTLD
ncbi:MAG: PilZ domain-containing protein [Spirochaetia bacterium]|nr:PilZ domain-containing protein [Spirochaetia bacterium]